MCLSCGAMSINDGIESPGHVCQAAEQVDTSEVCHEDGGIL